jgi:hypothetical protein
MVDGGQQTHFRTQLDHLEKNIERMRKCFLCTSIKVALSNQFSPICSVISFLSLFGSILGPSQIFLKGLSVFLANVVIFKFHGAVLR